MVISESKLSNSEDCMTANLYLNLFINRSSLFQVTCNVSNLKLWLICTFCNTQMITERKKEETTSFTTAAYFSQKGFQIQYSISILSRMNIPWTPKIRTITAKDGLFSKFVFCRNVTSGISHQFTKCVFFIVHVKFFT